MNGIYKGPSKQLQLVKAPVLAFAPFHSNPQAVSLMTLESSPILQREFLEGLWWEGATAETGTWTSWAKLSVLIRPLSFVLQKQMFHPNVAAQHSAAVLSWHPGFNKLQFWYTDLGKRLFYGKGRCHSLYSTYKLPRGICLDSTEPNRTPMRNTSLATVSKNCAHKNPIIWSRTKGLPS